MQRDKIGRKIVFENIVKRAHPACSKYTPLASIPLGFNLERKIRKNWNSRSLEFYNENIIIKRKLLGAGGSRVLSRTHLHPSTYWVQVWSKNYRAIYSKSAHLVVLHEKGNISRKDFLKKIADSVPSAYSNWPSLPLHQGSSFWRKKFENFLRFKMYENFGGKNKNRIPLKCFEKMKYFRSSKNYNWKVSTKRSRS